MKKTLIVIGFWSVAIVLIAAMVMSMGFSFPEALLIGVLFLPGALAARFFFSKMSFTPRKSALVDALFLTLAILVAETALVVFANIAIIHMRKIMLWSYDGYSKILFNPIFIGMILVLLIVGDAALSVYLGRRFPAKQSPVRFVSERRAVSLPKDEILYIESNDREVTVYATQGRIFRNKTAISQWDNLLGRDFLRIHRSYLVNIARIDSINSDTVSIDGERLPISRKYKDLVRKRLRTAEEWFANNN